MQSVVMNDHNSTTPVKLYQRGDDVGITTPSGGLIYNPFHKEFLSRIDEMTFSPGMFAYTASPSTRDPAYKGTPNRASLPSILSPDTQSLLFPAEIDENPILQLKLQEKLDNQCDENVQDTIHSFFKSHLIAPSPDTISDSKFGSTPKGVKKAACKLDSNPIVYSEASVQTVWSLPPEFDFDRLLEQFPAAVNTLNNVLSNVDNNQSSQQLPHECSISSDTVQHSLDDRQDNHSFLSVSSKALHHLSRRASRNLFTESSEVTVDTGCFCPDSLSCTTNKLNSEPSHGALHSTYLPTVAFKPTINTGKSVPEGDTGPLITEAAALQLNTPSDWSVASLGQNGTPETSGWSDDDEEDHAFRTHGIPTSSPPSSTRQFTAEESPLTHLSRTTPQSRGWRKRDATGYTTPSVIRPTGLPDSPNLSPILPSHASSISVSEEIDENFDIPSITDRNSGSPPYVSSAPIDVSCPSQTECLVMDQN
ncbi:unnamed protein product [Calicophoron daubneyi]|uniref:Protein aurora borealis n=1 Tax=Calicophoron daubneyi TaxID=300641 RepID=A0AAV2SZI6_CALDB